MLHDFMFKTVFKVDTLIYEKKVSLSENVSS